MTLNATYMASGPAVFRERNEHVKHGTSADAHYSSAKAETCVYRFAGHTVEVRPIYPQVHVMCREYRVEDLPEFAITTCQRDIDDERRRSDELRRARGDAKLRSSDAYLETLAIYRKMAESLIDVGVLLIHGSAVAVDGAGYLFVAKSGMGKSTHARFWRELLGKRCVMVNDDKPLLEITDRGAVVWGTPWDGKHHLSSNIAVPLRAICILERGDDNHIEIVSAEEALPALWKQIYKSTDPEKLKRTLTLTDSLSKLVRQYRLRCTPDMQAACVAFEAMSNGATL